MTASRHKGIWKEGYIQRFFFGDVVTRVYTFIKALMFICNIGKLHDINNTQQKFQK